MLYHVSGCNRITGQDQTVEIEAPTPQAAEAIAGTHGIFVSGVEVPGQEPAPPCDTIDMTPRHDWSRSKPARTRKDERHASAPAWAFAAMLLVVMGVYYVAIVRPLQARLAGAERKLNDLTESAGRDAENFRLLAGVVDQAANTAGRSAAALRPMAGVADRNTVTVDRTVAGLKSLASIVERNTAATDRTGAALASLTVTVNHNSEAINRNADGLASLRETVNHNAAAANRTADALSADLADLTRVVNFNANAANANRFR